MSAGLPKPPRLATALVRLCLHAVDADVVLGDLEETHAILRVQRGKPAADRWYWGQVVRSCPIFIYRTLFWSSVMLKNYAKIALRNLLKFKGYSFINIFGLSVGMACCLLLLLYILDEKSYDRFHENVDRIVRVVEDRGSRDSQDQGSIRRLAGTSYEIGPSLKNAFPTSITHAVRLYSQTALIFHDPAHKFQEERFFFADSTVFDVFSFPFLRGNPNTALDAPFTVVISASMAKKYFGDDDPLGQVLRYEGRSDFEITGVVEDVPENAHFKADFFASYATLDVFMPWTQSDWHWPLVHTYFLLADGVDSASLEAQLPDHVRRFGGEEQAAQRSFSFQPLTDVHLRSHRESELEANGDIFYVYFFSVIAGFILLIACINFINLTTARSVHRVKEVSMRKVMGSRRSQLIRQFLSETTLQVMIAFLWALVLLILLIPFFNKVTGKELTVQLFSSWLFPFTTMGMLVTIGILAGYYPAIYLSAFRPLQVLKGVNEKGEALATRLRKGLVVFQFTVSCMLIIGSGVVYNQLSYMQNKKLGFDKEHVVAVKIIDYPDMINYERYRDALMLHPNIINVTASNTIPGREAPSMYPVVPEGMREEDGTRIPTFAIDHDFIQTFKLELASGRTFSKDFSSDPSEAVVVNESAARALGWTEPVGRKVTLSYDHPDLGFTKKEAAIIGVVKDFHYASLHNAIDPTLLHILPPSQYFKYLSVRIRPNDIPATIAFLEEEWKEYTTAGYPFSFTFVDQEVDALYRTEERFGDIVTYFSLLAILISCLGLFGLAAFSAERRTKEIGVRKVLGASVGGIVVLLSRDFLKLTILAIAVAFPLAYVIMNRWLDAFAYQSGISLMFFLLTGLLTLFIALLTVSYQAIRAALTNPVDSLRKI